jgi:UDP:flavonoid glycosyltransferase YjiC (YdhE family)
MARYQAPDWWAELSNSRGVVVVTQGTLANDDLTELIAPTLEAMADSDALVVAATARADGPDDLRRLLAPVPPNACIGGYVPFDRLLPFADVLVTNGGYGGVHTALQHGVPLVVAGESEDKLDVSARVDWSGVGVDLRTAQPDRRALRAAIELVMQRRSFTRRAARLRAELSRYRPLETIDRVIREETAAGRRNPESSYRADAG